MAFGIGDFKFNKKKVAMAQNSKISWCNHTANIWWGCTAVHEGCDNCYAEALDNRYHHDNPHWGKSSSRLAVKSFWKDVARFQRKAKEANEIHRVFVGSMMDIFEKPMPLVNTSGYKILHPDFATDTIDIADEKLDSGYLRTIFFEQVIPKCPNLMFLLLTKRPHNINKYIPESWKESPPPNVMFGTSVVNQQTADKLIPQLLSVNGRTFLSVEPMLAPIDLKLPIPPNPHIMLDENREENKMLSFFSRHDRYIDSVATYEFTRKPDWIIVGGESGGNKRPFDPDWARDIMRQCAEAFVPFFMKQIDGVKPIPEDLMVREFPKN